MDCLTSDCRSKGADVRPAPEDDRRLRQTEAADIDDVTDQDLSKIERRIRDLRHKIDAKKNSIQQNIERIENLMKELGR